MILAASEANDSPAAKKKKSSPSKGKAAPTAQSNDNDERVEVKEEPNEAGEIMDALEA